MTAFRDVQKAAIADHLERLMEERDPDDVVEMRDQILKIRDTRDLSDLMRVFAGFGTDQPSALLWLVGKLYDWEDEDYEAFTRTVLELEWST